MMNNELSEFMKETTNQILMLKESNIQLKKMLDHIQKGFLILESCNDELMKLMYDVFEKRPKN